MLVKLTIAILAVLGLSSLGGPAQDPGAINLAGLEPAAWNEFTVEGFPPSAGQVASYLVTTAPEAEKATCEARLKRALRSPLTPPDLRERLLPLKGWEGKNVFLTRCRLGDHWVQVTEGAAQLNVEVRRVDGQLPLPADVDAETFVVGLARQLFNANMLPKELCRSPNRRAPKCAHWHTLEQPDQRGFWMPTAEVFADSTSIRYVFHQSVHTSPAIPGVPPYTFAPPPEPPVPPPPPPPEPEDIGLSAELTPEELANEVN